MRLQKYLALCGVASRRNAEKMIAEGLVSVNGNTVTEMGVQVDETRDEVLVGGKRVTPETEKHYLAYNKPIGEVTTVSDPEGRATVMDRFLILDRAFSPLLVISQTIPTIAIAPLLVLWMGFGMAPKITLVVITTFFPIAVGLLEGYRSVDPDAVDLLRAMGANRRQILR